MKLLLLVTFIAMVTSDSEVTIATQCYDCFTASMTVEGSFSPLSNTCTQDSTDTCEVGLCAVVMISYDIVGQHRDGRRVDGKMVFKSPICGFSEDAEQTKILCDELGKKQDLKPEDESDGSVTVTYRNFACDAAHCNTSLCNDPAMFTFGKGSTNTYDTERGGGVGRVTVGVAMVIAMVISLVLF